MSLTRCVRQLQAHFAYSRHLESILPSLSTEAQRKEKRKLISQSLSNIVSAFPPSIIRQAFKKVTVGEKPHLYMITFTFDPKKSANIAAAKKLLNSRLKTKDVQKCKPLLWMYSQETHKDGRPHFHAILQSELKCSPSSITRDWARKFGKTDFSTSTTRDLLPALTYITKETVPTILKTHKQAELLLTQLCPRNTSETSEN